MAVCVVAYLVMGASEAFAQNPLEFVQNKNTNPAPPSFQTHPALSALSNPFGDVREVNLLKPRALHATIIAAGFDFTWGFGKSRLFDRHAWKESFKKGGEQAGGAILEQWGMNLASQRGRFWGGKILFELGSSIKQNSRDNQRLLCRFETNYFVANVSYNVCERRFDYFIRAGQVLTTLMSTAKGDRFRVKESFRLGIPYFTTRKKLEGAAETRLGTIVAQNRWYSFPHKGIRSDVRALFHQHEGGHTFQYYRNQQCNSAVDGTFWKIFKKDYRKIPVRFGQDLCQIVLSTGRENSPLELEVRAHDGVLEEQVIKRILQEGIFPR